MPTQQDVPPARYKSTEGYVDLWWPYHPSLRSRSATYAGRFPGFRRGLRRHVDRAACTCEQLELVVAIETAEDEIDHAQNLMDMGITPAVSVEHARRMRDSGDQPGLAWAPGQAPRGLVS